ncbi:MAG: hypothetical protein R2711_18975 [Acidimicrobiales bacterium]
MNVVQRLRPGGHPVAERRTTRPSSRCGFTESLRIESDLEGGPVSATCVHPGGIKTNIARNARPHRRRDGRRPRAGRRVTSSALHHHAGEGRSPDLRAVERDALALIGPDAHVFNALSLFPRRSPSDSSHGGARRAL